MILLKYLPALLLKVEIHFSYLVDWRGFNNDFRIKIATLVLVNARGIRISILNRSDHVFFVTVSFFGKRAALIPFVNCVQTVAYVRLRRRKVFIALADLQRVVISAIVLSFLLVL